MSPLSARQSRGLGPMSIVFGLVLLLAACGTADQPNTMTSADDGSAGAESASAAGSTTGTIDQSAAESEGSDSGDETDDGDGGSVAPPADEGPAFTTTAMTPIDLSGSTDSADVDGDGDGSTEASTEPFWDVEILGISMVGNGDYVRLTDPADGNGDDVDSDEDVECGLGWLGYLVDGQIHRYTELGQVSHARLFNGLRGQDAIVVSCEESTERVLIQGSAVLPDDGVPRFTSFALGHPHYLPYDADFGWRGDLFGGYAWRDGFDELVYFDTGTNSIVDAAALAGTRIEQLDHGFDIVMPNGWEVLTGEAAAVTLAISPPDAGSYISVLSLQQAGDPEFPEDAELLDFWTDDAYLWDYVSADRGTIIGTQTRFNWRLSHKGGTLVIQHLEAGDRHLIVHYFVAPGEDHLWDVAQVATDQIRHYQYATVG